MKKEAIPTQQTVTTAPFPASKKIYVQGVAMREISLNDTTLHGKQGATEKNAPVIVYDTSGPYTDPTITIDVKKGLNAIRAKWIADRNDTEELSQLSSAYGRKRLQDATIERFAFRIPAQPA